MFTVDNAESDILLEIVDATAEEELIEIDNKCFQDRENKWAPKQFKRILARYGGNLGVFRENGNHNGLGYCFWLYASQGSHFMRYLADFQKIRPRGCPLPHPDVPQFEQFPGEFLDPTKNLKNDKSIREIDVYVETVALVKDDPRFNPLSDGYKDLLGKCFKELFNHFHNRCGDKIRRLAYVICDPTSARSKNEGPKYYSDLRWLTEALVMDNKNRFWSRKIRNIKKIHTWVYSDYHTGWRNLYIVELKRNSPLNRISDLLIDNWPEIAFEAAKLYVHVSKHAI